jgi:hypothetical protein
VLAGLALGMCGACAATVLCDEDLVWCLCSITGVATLCCKYVHTAQ